MIITAVSISYFIALQFKFLYCFETPLNYITKEKNEVKPYTQTTY